MSTTIDPNYAEPRTPMAPERRLWAVCMMDGIREALSLRYKRLRGKSKWGLTVESLAWPERWVWATALAERRAAEIRQAAQKLKSSSASIGALTLSGLCSSVEQLAVHGWDEALPQLVDALLAEGRRVQSALGALLGDQGRR